MSDAQHNMRYVRTILLGASLVASLGCGAHATHVESSPNASANEAPPPSSVASESNETPAVCVAVPEQIEDRIAQDAAEIEVNWAELRRYARCTPGTPEHTAAQQALSALDHALSAAALDADVVPLRQQLVATLELPCFAVASEVGALPHATSSESLKRWWTEGGSSWLTQYLTPMPRAASRNDEVRRSIILPPTEARVLTSSSLHATHPLRRVLCAANDADCDAEVRPFRMRLEHAIAEAQELARVSTDRFGEPLADRMAACERSARSEGAASRYLVWRRCVEGLRVVSPQMPVIHARAPHSGWLVAQSHTHPQEGTTCERYCAYDLATGSAHCATACGPSANDERGEVSVQRGNVELAYVRELAWVMLFADDIDRTTSPVEVMQVPAGLSPEWTNNEFIGTGMGGASGGCSSIISLRWIENGCPLFATLVAVSSADNPVDAYLGSLHSVLASALVEGTPRVPARGLASPPADHDHALQTRLIEALQNN